MGHVYDSHFMNYTGGSSRYSAMTITQLMFGALPVQSVLDVGCATGAWLKAWQEAGVEHVQGVDGSYVNTSQLLIDAAHFRSADLSGALQLDRRFDLVQSLEVAEHIAEKQADLFVMNLVDHSDGLILFSAAPPGQGGEYHVNEQPLDYWREKFASHGYRAFDFIRPRIAHDQGVSFWYRFNTLLYVRDDRIEALPDEVKTTRIPEGTTIADTSPTLFRIRKWLVRQFPYGAQQALARLKARFLPSGRF